MKAPDPLAQVTMLDGQLLAFLGVHPRLMFSALANYFPEHRWHTLLTALTRLRQLEQVDLVPHQWDYEIVLLNRERDG